MMRGKEKKLVFVLILAVGMACFVQGCVDLLKKEEPYAEPQERDGEFRPPTMPPVLEDAEQPKEATPEVSLPPPIEMVLECAVNFPLCGCCVSPCLSPAFSSLSNCCAVDTTPCLNPIKGIFTNLMGRLSPS